jgi:hypothetical protein
MDYLKRMKKINLEHEKELLEIDESFNFWTNILFEKCVRIFDWSGLPFPQKEIETRLLYYGYCGIVDDALKGIMCATGSLSGNTQYLDEFTTFIYSAPTAQGGNKTIDFDCVIIDNTTLRNSLYPLIERYASLLSHAEITLKSALINIRMSNTFSADNTSTVESIKAARKKIYTGDTDVILDESILNVNGVVNLTPSKSSDTSVNNAIDARNEILRAFFSEIGVRYNKDKKERMIESEIEQDTQVLLLNISDMEKQRKKACEKINKMFGLNVSCELSKEFKLINENTNDDKGDFIE